MSSRSGGTMDQMAGWGVCQVHNRHSSGVVRHLRPAHPKSVVVECVLGGKRLLGRLRLCHTTLSRFLSSLHLCPPVHLSTAHPLAIVNLSLSLSPSRR